MQSPVPFCSGPTDTNSCCRSERICACAGRRGQTAAVGHRSGADIQAIESLNRHDITAAPASDVDALVSQWTDDFVLIPPAGPVVRGRAANVAMIEQARPQLARFEPVAYEANFEEIIVAGDYAFACGEFKSAARPRDGGSDTVSPQWTQRADSSWLGRGDSLCRSFAPAL
jgi:ketosteroid isomerase-like protein